MPKVFKVTSNPQIMKPTFQITAKELPDIKNWKVGQTYTMEVKAKQISYRVDNNETSASFEIVSIKPEKESDETKNLKSKMSDHYRK